MKLKKRLYASLVTARPPKEIASDSITSSVQELSSYNPTVQVPQEDTPTAERVRSMLLYDAAITPADMPGAYGIPSWALDTARILRASRVVKNLPECGPLTKEEAETFNKMLSGYGYQDLSRKARLNAATGLNLNLGQFQQLIDETDFHSWDSTIQLARSFAKLAEENQERTQPPPQPGKGNPGQGCQEPPDYDDGDMEPSEMEEAMEEQRSKHPPMPRPNPGEGSGEKIDERVAKSLCDNYDDGRKPDPEKYDSNPWAPGCIPKPAGNSCRPGKLENPEKADQLKMLPRLKRKGVRKRPEMEGTVPSAFHRHMIDGKMFKGAPIRGGMRGRGTILVDMSGSMSWTADQFKALLEVLPECTVLGYAGRHHGRASTGRMVLLADRGRMADIDAVEKWKAEVGCENIIDGPCLAMLAKMPAPRIWISDGGVTGTGGRSSQYVIDVCNEAVVRGNIIRVRDGKDAVKVMLGR